MTPSKIVTLLVDESGSMASRRDETVGGANEYMRKLKKSDPDAQINFATFDRADPEPIVRWKLKEKAPKAWTTPMRDYGPRGSTPLLDAMGEAIKETRRQSKLHPDAPVMVIVMTDGHENASFKETNQTIAKKIAKREKDGWTFVYLAIGFDNWDHAHKLGIHRGNYMQTGASPQAMSSGMAHLAHTTSANTGSTVTAFADAGQTAADYADKADDKTAKTPKRKTPAS